MVGPLCIGNKYILSNKKKLNNMKWPNSIVWFVHFHHWTIVFWRHSRHFSCLPKLPTTPNFMKKKRWTLIRLSVKSRKDGTWYPAFNPESQYFIPWFNKISWLCEQHPGGDEASNEGVQLRPNRMWLYG